MKKKMYKIPLMEYYAFPPPTFMSRVSDAFIIILSS